jgi:hypothetical protein
VDSDYEALYRRLWQEVLRREGKIENNSATFVADFVAAIQAEGWQVGPESQQKLAEHLDSVTGALREGIAQAVAIGAQAATLAGGAAFADAEIQRLAEEAFTRAWPDGLTLSQRLWAWSSNMRAGVERELAAGIRQGAGVNRLLYDMQRAIEAAPTAGRFEIATLDIADWTDRLAATGRALIHDPATRQEWQLAVNEARRHIATLSESGTRHAALQAFKQITGAVTRGSEELLGKALHWWAYDKQLYLLKRIARTELSTAMHRAVIESTRDQPGIIGYHWRLSASHPRPDICDYYASVEMGLGRGVWRKEAVPMSKAHPHCMCSLIPRVTPIKTPGSTGYAAFVQSLPDAQQAALLPKWANRLTGLGAPVEKLLRPDGLGLMTRADVAARMGEDRFQAAQVLGKALAERDWGARTFRAGAMTRRSLAEFAPFAHVPEVKALIGDIEAGRPVDGLRLKYLKRKYPDGESIQEAGEMNAWFEAALRDPQARLLARPSAGSRYAVHSDALQMAAIIDPSGQRVSVYRHNGAPEGETWLRLSDLIAIQ